MLRVRLRGMPYVTAEGVQLAPFSEAELPADEANALMVADLADFVGGPVIERAVVSAPVELREDQEIIDTPSE